VTTTTNNSGFINDIRFEMDSGNGLIVNPTPVLVMFDFLGDAYSAQPLDDTENGIDFSDIAGDQLPFSSPRYRHYVNGGGYMPRFIGNVEISG